MADLLVGDDVVTVSLSGIEKAEALHGGSRRQLDRLFMIEGCTRGRQVSWGVSARIR